MLAIVALAAATRPAFASGGAYCEDLICRSFFSPEVIQSPAEAPFFLIGTNFRNSIGARQNDLNDVNTDEWRRYFNRAVPDDALLALIYKLELENVNALTRALTGRDVPLSNDAQMVKAALERYGRRPQVLASLDYLALAKRVEPFATRNTLFGPKEPPNTSVTAEAGRALVEQARTFRSSDPFLTERYHLQIVRLLYYNEQYDEAVRYFPQYEGAFANGGSPKYRAMAYAAGAYYKQRKFGQANYLFSQVFDQFPALKESAYLSFHPMEDADWRQTLTLAKNQREREVLWQLLGIYADGIEAITRIYQLNPKSTLLPLLLVREVNGAEADWDANRDLTTYADTTRRPKTDAQAVGTKRLATLKTIADAGNTDRPYLWKLAVGHLLALAGDYPMAERYLDAASASGGAAVTAVRTQIHMSRLFSRVRAASTIDRSAQPYFAAEFSWLSGYLHSPDKNPRAEHLEEWGRMQLSAVYTRSAAPIRGLMLSDTPGSPLYQSVADIDRIVAFMRSASTPFDKWLVRAYGYSTPQLDKLRAINFMYTGDFAKALAAFNAAGAGGTMLPADPFTIHIRDCHQCDYSAEHTAYTNAGFAEKMLRLSRAAQGRGETAAAASFELANGFYNMSYWGNSRAVYGTEHDNFHEAAMTRNSDAAEKYYLQASNLTSNRELKTKALFMASKAEQNRYYVTRKKDSDPQPHSYFRTLRASFSDTEYYQEIIRECGTFRRFLQQ